MAPEPRPALSSVGRGEEMGQWLLLPSPGWGVMSRTQLESSCEPGPGPAPRGKHRAGTPRETHRAGTPRGTHRLREILSTALPDMFA